MLKLSEAAGLLSVVVTQTVRDGMGNAVVGQHYDAMRDGPPCPGWCTADHVGWTRRPGSTVKMCRREIGVDGGSVILIERYAALEEGVLVVQDPEIRVRADEALGITDATTLADSLRRVTELVTETMVAT